MGKKAGCVPMKIAAKWYDLSITVVKGQASKLSLSRITLIRFQ